MSIENRCGEIKATLQKLTDVKVSPTARLVAVLASCGITDTAEVASLVGRSVRMVQVARNELRETHCADAQPIAPDATHCAKPIAQNETHCAPRVHAPAQMESPSEIDSSQEVASSADEIEGLNGSTGYFTTMLAGWLAGPMSVPDPETSHRLLVGYVSAYSPEAVKSGMVELETEIVQGRRPRDVGKAFSGFVRKAHERGSGGTAKVAQITDWQQAKADKIELTRKLRKEWAEAHAQ